MKLCNSLYYSKFLTYTVGDRLLLKRSRVEKLVKETLNLK